MRGHVIVCFGLRRERVSGGYYLKVRVANWDEIQFGPTK